MLLHTIQSISFISSKSFQRSPWLSYLNHALYKEHWIINSTVRKCFHPEPRKITLSEIFDEELQNHPCAIKSNKSMCCTFKTGSEEEVSIESPSQHSAKCTNEYWRIERPGVNQHRTSTNGTNHWHFAPSRSATSKVRLSYRISCCVKLATSSVFKFKSENVDPESIYGI